METLSCGHSGHMVKKLQSALKRAGYNLTVDGLFGGETHAAVVHFQRSLGLDPDGVVGDLTWSKLERYMNDYTEIQQAWAACLAAIEALPEYKTLSGLLEED